MLGGDSLNIGDKIKSLRKEKGLSQEDLAKKCGLNRNSIYKYEKNETTPKLNQIKKIAAALNVEVNELTYLLYYDEIHKEQIKEIVKNKENLVITEKDRDGNLKEELQKYIKELSLNDKVYLLGKKENPFAYISKTDCFVFYKSFGCIPYPFVSTGFTPRVLYQIVFSSILIFYETENLHTMVIGRFVVVKALLT